MYRRENWTIKKAVCRTIDAFKLCCWKRFSRLPWGKEIKPENPKEINPDYSLDGLMLKLKLQYSGHLMQSDNSLEKTLMLGKIQGRRKRGQ